VWMILPETWQWSQPLILEAILLVILGIRSNPAAAFFHMAAGEDWSGLLETDMHTRAVAVFNKLIISTYKDMKTYKELYNKLDFGI
jgi:hypothetical protein